MRKIESVGNAERSASLSDCADSRSWPNGFSMTTRRQRSGWSAVSSTSPEAFSCSATSGKSFGGIDR